MTSSPKQMACYPRIPRTRVIVCFMLLSYPRVHLTRWGLPHSSSTGIWTNETVWSSVCKLGAYLDKPAFLSLANKNVLHNAHMLPAIFVNRWCSSQQEVDTAEQWEVEMMILILRSFCLPWFFPICGIFCYLIQCWIINHL